ncbi:uncharacterized protein PRCAT00005708001 [Priceomyces carsonii]|uniref:uncharacterized protein n=1 Tax=Priceomyces carsonii TaxID=28549 RepID=UPI002EDAD51D|nr:unnamed protein product [Priceomyces carsonii]
MQHARIYNLSNSKATRVTSSNQTKSDSVSKNYPNLNIGSKALLNKNAGATLTVGRKRSRENLHVQDKPTESQVTPKESIRSTSISDISYADLRDTFEPVKVTVWFHELRTSDEDVIIDSNALPGSKVGDVYELETLLKVKKLVFVIGYQTLKDNTEQAQKYNFQVSLISNPLQKLMDLPPRSLVLIKKVSDISLVEADSIEIYIKDTNFSRDSMWAFSSNLVNTCCYVSKRLTFLGSRTGVVKYIYKNGRRILSAFISHKTKVVFRSESANIVFLIQLSREMWHFEENGEIMFHKLVNNLFPKIFKTWRDSNSHHSISIVLFTSVDLTNTPWISLCQGERPKNRRDYFRVVVDQVSVYHWDKIMANLRLEFANFKRDIMLNTEGDYYINEGESLPSVKGNILEAINVGMTMVTDRFKNTDLKHTSTHFVVITPGTGLYDVDYDLLLKTSKKMGSSDNALDIICLSQPPLHVVPLFRYSMNGKICHSVPNWCYISFYRDNPGHTSQWIPRCKIYELQMMGVMENDGNEILLARFEVFQNAKSVVGAMENYDKKAFMPINTINKSEGISKAIKNASKLGLPGLNSVLSLINVSRGENSTAKTNVSTTNSSVLGTVANTDATALSSLYFLNKNTEEFRLLPSSKSRSITPASSINRIKPLGIQSRQTDSSSVTAVNKNENNEHKIRDAVRIENHRKSSVEPEPKNVSDLLWVDIDNPSKDALKDILRYFKYGRWNDVFPTHVKRRLIKWRSFQSPAVLPITVSAFPTTKQLECEYTFQIYTVILNDENYLELGTTSELMRELIQLRLLLGFQICYNEKVVQVETERGPEGNAEKLIKYFPKGSCYGTIIYLSLLGEIHRITCDYNGYLNIQLYRKIQNLEEKRIKLGPSPNYIPLIRTRYVEEYSPAKVDILKAKPKKYNWNQFDQFLAGYEDSVPDDNKIFHQMKFVVVPSKIPKNAFYISNEKLTDEEIRVEGLRKLIGIIERGKYIREQKSGRKEEILPDINFYTGNLYDFLNEQAENYDMTGNQPPLMLPDSIRFNKNIKLSLLSQALQDLATGLRLVDRTWHFKTHPHCFIGSELVSWLIEGFDDIDNRDQATAYGQNLMDRALFKHVENRHGFLDGHYFYEFEDEYREKSNKSEKTSWFNKIKDSETSSNAKQSSDNELQRSPYLAQDSIGSETSSLSKSKKKFILSRMVKFNVDPLKKSFRNELVTVHYDRVHNPEHCYHIRFQWLNTTSKFIDETINNWSRLCDRHGLKLIETPWEELCTIPFTNQFHSYVELKLELNPWTDPEFLNSAVLKDNIFQYHLYLLKKSGFLLDNRSSVFFQKENIETSYSWGKPTFRYAQFIHTTGYYIVELRTKGDFFLAPNNYHIKRLNVSSIQDPDAQQIMLDFSSACKNKDFLRQLFREAKAASSTREQENILDADILPSYI